MVPVVLLVAPARILDLAIAGDGSRLAPELLRQSATGHVKTVRQLALQPVIERRVRFDRNLSDQRFAVQVGQIPAPALPNMEINQAAAQVVTIHPLGDVLVIGVGHQQGQAEPTHQALCSALPFARIIAHLEQFTREGHLCLCQLRCGAQRCANLNLLVVDVTAPPFQAVDLGLQGSVFQLALAQADTVLGQGVL